MSLNRRSLTAAVMLAASLAAWSCTAGRHGATAVPAAPIRPVQMPVPGAPVGVIAFQDVAVVPMDTERVLANQTVLIANGRIVALGPVSQVDVPANAVRIDGRGKYLIPGLGDMHVHIGSSVTVPHDQLKRYDSTAVEHRLFLWLANGVTTIRNMDYHAVAEDKPWVALDGAALLRLRARAAAGTLWSPYIYTSGPWAGALSNTPERINVEQVDSYVRVYRAAGYDFVKLHDEGGVLAESLVTAAHRVGLPVDGHAMLIGRVEPLLAVVRQTGTPFQELLMARALTAYRSIEHLTGYALQDTSRFPALAAAVRRADLWNCPTLSLSEQQSPAEMPYRRQLVKALQDADAGLLLGTDAPVTHGQHYLGLHGKPAAAHDELDALVRAGLTPYQALTAGTKNVAALLGIFQESGTIAVGKQADLLLLSGNPLEDIRHARQPAGVMLGGRWLSRAAIDQRLASIQADSDVP